jgi:hypothetical protein
MRLSILPYISALLFIALFSSCEKDATITPLVSTTPLTGTGTGTGGGTTPTPVTGTDYQPLTTGTTWRYQNIQDGKTDTSTITITGKTKVVDAKTFFEITEKTGSVMDTSYFYKGNNIYISNTQNYAEGFGTEFIYLHDNQAVGYTWSGQAIASNPLASGTYTGKIMEKNISKTILGKVYTNVIHTQVVITLTILGTPGTITNDMYVAKGIGIVQADINDGTDVSTSKMIDYNVK